MILLSLILMAQPRERLLRQPLRRRLVALIKRRPGIHASELCRESGEPWGTVHYHLSLLQKGDLVQAVDAGRERRFFPPSANEQHMRLLATLYQGRRQEIARFIHQHPGMRQVDVCEQISVSRKTFRSSIQPLVEEGLVEERKGVQVNRYFPQERLVDLFEHDDAFA